MTRVRHALPFVLVILATSGCALVRSDVKELRRTTTEKVTFEDGSAIERSKTSAVTVTKTPPTP